ncbi:MAG: endonuclease [Chloroflexi bacterium]|jgi:predicted Holliday junction resolvase-like endonuclease|nr:endonuclease [Chloroflexota bacterium]
MEQVIWLFVGLIIGFLVAALLVYWFLGWREKNLIQRYELRLRQMTEQYEARLRQMEEKHRQEVEQARRQSVEQSRHTIKGQISEQLVPLLPGFKFFPADARFIGHPIDYVVFHGYTDLRDGNGGADQLEVVLVDIKRNTATLTKEQRAIMEAVRAGRVSFQVVRVDEQGNVQSHTVGYRKA